MPMKSPAVFQLTPKPTSQSGSGPMGDGSEFRSDAISARLRAAYATIIEEPIPDEFLQLLDRISRSEGEK
jgi:Anti-sigma factor NepR